MQARDLLDMFYTFGKEKKLKMDQGGLTKAKAKGKAKGKGKGGLRSGKVVGVEGDHGGDGEIVGVADKN